MVDRELELLVLFLLPSGLLTLFFVLRDDFLLVNIKSIKPAIIIPMKAKIYPTISSELNIIAKKPENSPTELGPKMEPKAENHTATDSATFLYASETIKEAKYLVWSVADWPTPNMKDPINIKIVES